MKTQKYFLLNPRAEHNLCFWVIIKTSAGIHKPQRFYFPLKLNIFQEPHCVTGNVTGSSSIFAQAQFLNFLTDLNFDYVLWTVGQKNRPKPSNTSSSKHIAVKIKESAKVWPKYACRISRPVTTCCSLFIYFFFSYVKSVKRWTTNIQLNIRINPKNKNSFIKDIQLVQQVHKCCICKKFCKTETQQTTLNKQQFK